MFATLASARGEAMQGPPDEIVHVDDLALAAAVAGGDRGAASRLTQRLLPVVGRIARALSHSPADADDASQIAVLEVLRAVGAYRGQGPIEAWARRIASRAVIRHARRSRRDPTSMSGTAEHEEAPTQPSDRTSMTMLETLPRPLEDYLAELPEPQRLTLVLRHALEHSVSEIAELTDAPVPTVKSRIKRAHQELRRLIQRDLNLGVRKARTS
jgi:RNA polymerase sigma-70 factor, ECF subfamily